MLETAQRWVPIATDAFREYRLNGAQLSASALTALRRMIAGEQVSQEDSGMTAREWRELQAVLKPEAD